MAKITGAYTSLSRGISQQVPEARLIGQHEHQVNMLTDPVIGLTRRAGTEFHDERVFNTGGQIPPNGPTRDSLRNFRVADYTTDGVEYSVLYPKLAASYDPSFPGGQTLLSTALVVLRKTTTTGGLGGFRPTVFANANTVTRFMEGISSATQLGRFLILTPKQGTPQPSQTDAWLATSNTRRAVIWVRGGAYSRRFKVTVTLDGNTYNATYTTPSASYGGSLNTTDIPFDDPEYTKKVNDRVNAYNAAVTQWIGTSGAAIQPPNIAQQLATSLENNTGNQGLFFADGAHVYISYNGLMALAVDDGGDGTLLRGVHMTVKSADLVSDHHYRDKVVQVQATPGEPAYYLRAVPLDGVSSYGPVRWEETARITMPTPTCPFLIGTIQNDTFYIADSPAALRAAAPLVASQLPDFSPRLVGDEESSPLPAWWTRPITYSGMFQDRLVIGVGAVLSMSEPGNYFNFFRATSLTVKDSDPVEVFALGTEDDTIRHSVIFDKSLLLFGDKQQYSIDGRVPVTPATTTVIQSSAVEDSTDAAPVAVGDLVFFAKRREAIAQLYQIEIGDVQDTSNSSDVGLQLSDYLTGAPSELLAVTSPNLVLFRTTESPRTIFVYRYIDQGRERVLDSWSRFDYDEAFGEILGLSLHNDQVVLLVHREAVTRDGVTWLGANGARSFIVAETQSLMTTLSGRPYLDSLRRWSAFSAGSSSRSWWNQPWLQAGMDGSSPYWLQGHNTAPGALAALQQDYPDVDSFKLWVGVPYPSYVTLTSPFRRDAKDTALTDGRLTVNRLDVSYRNAGGFNFRVEANGTEMSVAFNGRRLGASNNNVGQNPVSTGTVPCAVGKDSRQYRATITARDWQPLTITSIGWTGQWFYNAQRA